MTSPKKKGLKTNIKDKCEKYLNGHNNFEARINK